MTFSSALAIQARTGRVRAGAHYATSNPIYPKIGIAREGGNRQFVVSETRLRSATPLVAVDVLGEHHRLRDAGGDLGAVGAGAAEVGLLAEQTSDARALPVERDPQRLVARDDMECAVHAYTHVRFAVLHDGDAELVLRELDQQP